MGARGPVRIATGVPAPDRDTVARGYLLIAVFYVHALYGIWRWAGGDPGQAMMSGAQIKLLAPSVSAFFLLSGMAAPHMHRKGWTAALRPSLTLLILAALSHLVTVALDLALYPLWYGWKYFAIRLFRPIVWGTGYENFIAWFFVVLAFARVFAYALLRDWRVFALLAAAATGLVLLTQMLGLRDNIYEWRNWPTATLFFLIGMRIPPKLRIALPLGLAALVASLALAWINRPGLLAQGPCLTCELGFVAQPMVGQYGLLPVYLVQQLLFAAFLLSVAAFTRAMMPGRVAAYFGANSLAMLVLHGWVLATLYPLAARSLANGESVARFVAILSSVIVAHAFLYFCLQTPLRWFCALPFRASGHVFAAFDAVAARLARPTRAGEVA